MQRIPTVSIIMTCYNREKYIGEAIESVLENGYNDFELIIVDDGSTDNTVVVASSYEVKDGRIRFYKNEKNLGDYPNRNRASSYATGKFLINVDSDDTMFPGVLLKWVQEMEEADAQFGIFAKMGNDAPILLSPNEAIRKHFFEQPILSFGPGATIVRRDFFYRMKAFPVAYGPANDMYYNLKLTSSTSTLFFPYPLVNYRIHESQERNNAFGYLFNNYRYLRDALMEVQLPLSGSEIRFLRKKNKRRFVLNLAKYWLRTRDFRKTARAVKNAEFTAHDFLTGIFHV